MQHNTPKRLVFVLLALPLLLSGCLNEDTQPQPEQSVTGRIVLSSVGLEDYVDAETRATQSLTEYDGYTYTLTGTSLIDGRSLTPVNGDLEYLMNGDASLELEAGTYRLTISNESAPQTGVGFPIYSGYRDFTLHVEDVLPVTIDMGKPINAKLTIELHDDGDDTDKDTFAELYRNVRFTVGGRTIDLSSPSTVAYFPAGEVSYTLSASAKPGSHVTDITSASGSITLKAGCSHTLTLKADPVSGVLIPVVSGTHDGVFD